jgi:hypothetical protein
MPRAPRPGARRPPAGWTRAERARLRRLSTPARVQDQLDRMAYRVEDRAACPRRALEEGRAHCYDGALLAAAALRLQGHAPRIVGMWAERDDGHVLAVYRARGGWGAVAKSNFVGLRYRDPVYRTLRELVMSYFEDYFTLEGRKSLRSHTRPLDLRPWDRLAWETSDAPLPAIHDRLTGLPDRFLLTPAQARALARVDRRSLEAGTVGTVLEGVHRG